jgi:hypothetical protein
MTDPRELVLAQLRVSSLRCRLCANEIDTIGVALKGGFISPECAIEWVSSLEDPVPGLIRPESEAA